ncbi:hypothetical protein PENTCL1PPCAC_6699, partial [Pristionchus entomophagus]
LQMTSRFARKRKSNEENEGPKELKPNQILAKKWREEAEITQISGRVKCIELENFMCHEKLIVEFDLENNNCFYIGGPNGSGKSALFAAMNIGLGGRGNHNDRGNAVKNYIKDGRRSAKIRITLTNTGQSSHPSYGEYSIVERTINQTCSTYVLKSYVNGKEVRVSTRKADLDKLMNRYGIQLVNPIFWMSQDRSRHFLQQMKPEKLYEIFMFATELDSTREYYKQLDQAVFDIGRVIIGFNKSFNDKKMEIKKLAEHRSQMVKIDEREHAISVMGWYLLWFPLRDVLADLEELERKKAEVLAGNADLKQRMDLNRRERAGEQEKTEALNNSIGTITDASAAESAALRDADAKRKQIESEIKGVNESIQESKTEEKRDERQIKEIEGEIKKREDALMTNGKANEKMRMERRLREIDTEMDELEENVKKGKNKMDVLKAETMEKQKEDDRIKTEKYQCERNMKRAVDDLQESAAVAKNELARFGQYIPNIVSTIKQNASRFEFEPLGPIGRYVSVREEEWTLAIETAIGKNLELFVIHSQKDRQLLFDLCRQMNVPCPNVIVTNFRVPPHDTRRNEPPHGIPTVERMIDFSHPVIRNALIDVAKIESIMLIDSDEEAREILDGRCPLNVFKAFTRTGGSGSGKNSQGGVYRFYPHLDRNATARLLMKKRTYDAKQLNYIIDTEKAKLKELETGYQKVKSVMDELGRAKMQIGKKLGDMETRKNTIGTEKRQVTRKLEGMADDETEDSSINSLKDSIAEIRKIIMRNREEREEFIKTSTAMEEKLKEAKAAVKEAQRRVDDAQSGSGPLENELRKVRAKIDQLDATYEKFMANQRKLTAQNDSFHRQYVELDKRKEKANETAELRKSPEFLTKFAATGGKPAEFDDPPDFSVMPSTEEAQRMYDDKVMEVNAAKKALNAINYDESKYRNMVNEYNHHSKTFKKLKKVFKLLELQKQDREEKFPIIRQAVTMRLKNSFYKLMNMRNFRGILRVKNGEKVIEITVEKNGETRERERMRGYEDSDYDDEEEEEEEERNPTQDLKGLSGGERSYTTACFIMSLWEIMEAPFRCMDEFDVFMDMVNRKVVMELLVKLATEQFAHNQFIFFTPQGIRELGKRDKVQIFEMPKVRD